MVHHLRQLAVEEDLREKLPGYDADFPYTAIHSELDQYDGRCVSWHWHESFEYSVVVSGALEMVTRNRAYRLNEGDALFINSNALHATRAIDGIKGATLHVHIFDRNLIAATNCVLRRYVGPVAACGTLDALLFQKDDERAGRISRLMQSAFEAARAEDEGYELQIASVLCAVWRDIYDSAREVMTSSGFVTKARSARIKDMLSYIRANYANDITPRMIGAHVGVCERECYRCFKRELDMTPLDCLRDYRISVACGLLACGDKSITEISGLCGFASPGYFSRVFAAKMLCSPREYRKRALVMADVYRKLMEAEKELEEGKGVDGKTAFEALRKKF